MNENKTNINWYPGHMAKTKRLITENLNLIDITAYDSDNIFVDPSKRRQKNEPFVLKLPNPDRLNVGITRIDKIGQRTLSQDEIAQSQKTLLNPVAVANGEKPIINKTCAVDPKFIPYGSYIYIPSLNMVLRCNDCGSKIKGNGRIDIYLKDYNTCMKFGVQDLEGYVLTPDMMKQEV